MSNLYNDSSNNSSKESSEGFKSCSSNEEMENPILSTKKHNLAEIRDASFSTVANDDEDVQLGRDFESELKEQVAKNERLLVENAQLHNDNNNNISEVGKLKHELQQMELRVVDGEDYMRLQNVVMRLKSEKLVSEKVCDDLKREIRDLKSSLIKSNSDNEARLKLELENTIKLNLTQTDEIRGKLDAARKEIERLQAINAGAVKAKQELNADLQDSIKKLKDAEQKESKFNDKKVMVMKKVKEMEDKLVIASQEKAKFDEMLKNEHQKSKSTINELSILKLKIAEYEKSSKDVTKAEKLLTDEIMNLKNKLNVSERVKEQELKQRDTKLNSVHEETRKYKDWAEKNEKQLKLKIQELTTMIKDSEKTKLNLQDKIDELSELKAVLMVNKKINLKCEQLVKENQGFLQKTKGMNTRMAEMDSEIEKFKLEMKKAEEFRSKSKSESLALKSKLDGKLDAEKLKNKAILGDVLKSVQQAKQEEVILKQVYIID